MKTDRQSSNWGNTRRTDSHDRSVSYACCCQKFLRHFALQIQIHWPVNLSSLGISPAQFKSSCIIYVHCIWIPANLKIWLLLAVLSCSWSLWSKHVKGPRTCYFLNYMQLFNLGINHIHLSKDNFKVRELRKGKFQLLILASPNASAYS